MSTNPNTPRTNTLVSVAECMRAFGQETKISPHVADDNVNALRTRLLQEELDELEAALANRDLVATLDALTDLQYVLDGAYLALGFAAVKDAAFEEVHRSNMSKLLPDGRPIHRADGKFLKGPNYSPPDLAKVLLKQRLGQLQDQASTIVQRHFLRDDNILEESVIKAGVKAMIDAVRRHHATTRKELQDL